MDTPGMRYRAMLDGILDGPEFTDREKLQAYKDFLKRMCPGAKVTHVEGRTSSLEEEGK